MVSGVQERWLCWFTRRGGGWGEWQSVAGCTVPTYSCRCGWDEWVYRCVVVTLERVGLGWNAVLSCLGQLTQSITLTLTLTQPLGDGVSAVVAVGVVG